MAVRHILTAILIVLLLGSCSTFAKVKYPPVKTDRAMSYIESLSDPWKYYGRKSSTVSGAWAMAIIAEQFEEWGLEPLIGDDFLIPFNMLACDEEKANLALVDSPWGRIDFLLGDDFTLCTNSGSGIVKAPVTIVGHGFDKPEKGWNDYEGVDVRGKIVVIVRGRPDNGEIWLDEFPRTYTFPEAVSHGAAAVLYYDRDFPVNGATIVEEAYNPYVPAGYIGSRAMKHLLSGSGYSIKSYKEKLKEGPLPLELDKVLQFQAKTRFIDNAIGWNVVGVVPGKDPKLSNEAVIIGAHGDHTGQNALGYVYPGADDNASGTGVVMEQARVFAKYPRKRTLIFCIFGAEEQGLLGSKALVPELPDEYTYVAMINLDMVGRGEGVFGLGGGDMLPEIWNPWWEKLDEEQREGYAVYRTWGGESSDHAPFRDANIPAFTGWSKGSHDFYHSTEDLFSTIDRVAIDGALKGAALWTGAVGSYSKSMKDARLGERTIWHRGLPLSWHKSTGEPSLDLDLAVRRMNDGYMGLVFTLPKPVIAKTSSEEEKVQVLVDSSATRLKHQFAVLDRWKDALSNSTKAVFAKNLKDLPGNSYNRKATIFLAIEADSLVQSDTIMIQASHTLGSNWAVLRSHRLWTLEGSVRAGKTRVLNELAKDGAVIQVPLRNVQEWIPVAEKAKGSIVAIGNFKDFMSNKPSALDKLIAADGGIVVILGMKDIANAVKAKERIAKYKVHIQPFEQEYMETLAWVNKLTVSGVDKETIVQWIGGNMKLWK